MKRKEYIKYLSRAFMAVAVMGTISACVLEDPSDDCILKEQKGDGLSLVASVSESSVKKIKTKAEGTTPSDADLKEKDLVTLDVFVEHVTGGTGDGTIMLQYHLTSTPDAIQEKVNNLLAEDWRAQGLKIGEFYNIYVATNNTQTSETKDLNSFNVAALKALVADEVTDGVAILDESTNNITWGETTTSGNIYKLYNQTPGNWRALTSDKKFMMDGVIENWTPNPKTADQVFDVTLNRAAAKIVLNVKFDATFLSSLAEENISITGSPAWKFYNFAFGAQVFDPKVFDQTATFTPIEVHNSDFNIFHNQNFTGDDKHFQIVTYTYPNTWKSANYATDSPSLVISVGYTENGNTNYHYYRIPIVPSTVNIVERNHIYVINATIATKGSTPTDDQEVIQDVDYEVLPWNDEFNSQAIHNEVQSVQHYYFNVNPKVYTLRGDGNQSVVLNYSKAAGTKVKWKLFEINASTGEKGNAVASTSSSAVWGWFYNKNGSMATSLSNDGSGINWNHMGVTIEQSTEGTSGSNGTVTVTSTALNNRAIKYMLLRVYLDEPSTFSGGKETMYEDILIRHFPTDNIQSIEGKWSSYTDNGATTREYSWDPVADGWEEGTYQSEEIPVELPATPAEYLAGNAQRKDYEQVDMNDGYWDWDYYFYYYYRTYWTYSVPQNFRQGANSEANAYLADDGYYYWGTGSQINASYRNDYDWTTGTGRNTQYYRYRYFYYAKYVKTEQRTRYYRDVEGDTGNWVDWERDYGQSGTSKYVTRSDDPLYTDSRFDAHVFLNGTVHYIGSTNNNNAYDNRSVGNSYTNNHMYVVQISSTSDDYVLGRPYVNASNHQSQDEVVSPAFMIASQLGIVSTGWDSASAAEHCSRYLEVATDGTRYSRWRLPTKDEIEIINEYQRGVFGNITIPQNDRIMDYVLKGQNYFNLSGGTTAIKNYTGNTGNFLRCVRDLSAEEVKKLNGFEALQEKYQ